MEQPASFALNCDDFMQLRREAESKKTPFEGGWGGEPSTLIDNSCGGWGGTTC